MTGKILDGVDVLERRRRVSVLCKFAQALEVFRGKDPVLLKLRQQLAHAAKTDGIGGEKYDKVIADIQTWMSI